MKRRDDTDSLIIALAINLVIALLICELAACIGCSESESRTSNGEPRIKDDRQTTDDAASSTPQIDEATAIRLAEEKYGEYGGHGEYEIEVEKGESGYTVDIVQLPYTAGGHFMVRVSLSGEVMEVGHGR